MRVLVVDSDPLFQHAVKRAGRDMMRGAFATSVDETVGLLREQRFEVLATNWTLGHGRPDGVALVRAARADGHSVPILVYSMRQLLMRQRTEAITAGAQAVILLTPEDGHDLLAPDAFEYFVAQLRTLAERVSGEIALARHRVGPLVIDIASHEFFVDGIRVKLTKNEFKLVELLMASAPHPVGYAELYKAIGCAEDVDSHAVPEAFRRLRGKLGEAAKLIVSLPGAGYRLAGSPNEAKPRARARRGR